MELFGDGAEDGIGLDELDLGGEELVGIGGGGLVGLLAEDAGGHAAIDVDGGGGLVDGRDALGDDEGGDDAGGDEGDDLPAVALEDPEVVGEGDGGLLGLGVGAVPGRRRREGVGDGGQAVARRGR